MITQAWIRYENLLLSRGQIGTEWVRVCLRGVITHQDSVPVEGLGSVRHNEASLKRKELFTRPEYTG